MAMRKFDCQNDVTFGVIAHNRRIPRMGRVLANEKYYFFSVLFGEDWLLLCARAFSALAFVGVWR
jgi:hypothetical protein